MSGSDIIIWFVSVVVTMVVGILIGLHNGRDIEQRAAAKAGVGEYRIDPERGHAVFTYKKEGK